MKEDVKKIMSYIELLESNGEYLCAEVFRNELEEVLKDGTNGNSERDGE